MCQDAGSGAGVRGPGSWGPRRSCRPRARPSRPLHSGRRPGRARCVRGGRAQARACCFRAGGRRRLRHPATRLGDERDRRSGLWLASGVVDAGCPVGLREGVHDLGIELDPGELPELGHRLLTRERRQAIGARCRHRLEGVGHVEDPRQHRDLVAHQAVGIAGAVVPLVVVSNDRQLGRQPRHRGDDVRADHRVRVHDRALLPGQEARLVEDAVRNADLPDVVEQPTPLQGLELLLGPPHHAPDVHRDHLDPLAVAGCPVAPCVDGLRQAGHRLGEHLAHLDDSWSRALA